MQGTRAILPAIEGQYDDAAARCVRATGEPNAHFHIAAIAAACLALAGRESEARGFAQRASRAHRGYSIQAFERSFPHRLASHRDLLAQALRSMGVPQGMT